MLVQSIGGWARFDEERFAVSTLARTDRSITNVIGLMPGQALPVHRPASDVTIVVIEGKVTMISAKQEIEHAGPGSLLHAKAGEARGVYAEEYSVLLAVASPPPTLDDHKEIIEHLRAGTWR